MQKAKKKRKSRWYFHGVRPNYPFSIFKQVKARCRRRLLAHHIGRQSRPNLRDFESFDELSGDVGASDAGHFCIPFLEFGVKKYISTTLFIGKRQYVHKETDPLDWCHRIIGGKMTDPKNKQRISIYIDRDIVKRLTIFFPWQNARPEMSLLLRRSSDMSVSLHSEGIILLSPRLSRNPFKRLVQTASAISQTLCFGTPFMRI